MDPRLDLFAWIRAHDMLDLRFLPYGTCRYHHMVHTSRVVVRFRLVVNSIPATRCPRDNDRCYCDCSSFHSHHGDPRHFDYSRYDSSCYWSCLSHFLDCHHSHHCDRHHRASSHFLDPGNYCYSDCLSAACSRPRGGSRNIPAICGHHEPDKYHR